MKSLKSNLYAKFEKSQISDMAKVFGGVETSDYGTGSLGRDLDKKSTAPNNSDWRDSSAREDAAGIVGIDPVVGARQIG